MQVFRKHICRTAWVLRVPLDVVSDDDAAIWVHCPDDAVVWAVVLGLYDYAIAFFVCHVKLLD